MQSLSKPEVGKAKGEGVCVSTTTRMAGNLGFTAYVVSDATATFDMTGPDGARHPAELMHAVGLTELHGEFATVLDTRAVLELSRNGARA